MPDVLQIPADLTLLLRDELVSSYSSTADEACHAANDYVAAAWHMHRGESDRESVRALGAELCRHRARIADLEQLFELLADDLTEGDDVAVPDEPRTRRLLRWLLDETIDTERARAGDVDDAQHVIATARRLERLIALRAELEREAVTA